MTASEAVAEQKSFFRIAELLANPVKGNFDTAHLKEIHRRIFQDSPQHGPGQFRPFTPVYIKRRSLESRPHDYRVHYAPGHGLEEAMAQALMHHGVLIRALPPKPNTPDFAASMARLYGDLDYLHPFKEGNSRTLRTFTAQWALEVGCVLDWGTASANAVTRDALYVARDLDVTARAFPGLDFEQAASTANRAEFDAWVSFVSKYPHHDSLAVLIAAATRPLETTPLRLV